MADHVVLDVPEEVKVTYGDGCTTLEGKVHIGDKPTSEGTVWISWTGGQQAIQQGVKVQNGEFKSTFGTQALPPRDYEIGYHYEGEGDVKKDASGKVTVVPKPFAIEGLVAKDKDYDTSSKAEIDTTAAKLVGRVGADEVEFDASNPNGTFDTPKVGQNKNVKAPGITLKGSGADRYVLTPPVLKASIRQKIVTVKGLVAQNKEYDGTLHAHVVTKDAALVGVFSPDEVKLDVAKAAATFDQSDAGHRTVTVSGLTLTGSAAGNYALQQPVVSACIQAKSLEATGITAKDKPYDGNTEAELNTSHAGLSGVLDSDSGGVTLDTSEAKGVFASATPNDKVGVTVSGLKLAGVKAHNYSLPQSYETHAAIWPQVPADFDLSMDVEKALFRQVSEAAATVKYHVTNSYALAELDLIIGLSKNPLPSQRGEIVRALVQAAQKGSAATADGDPRVFAPVAARIAELILFYSAPQEGSQAYGKLLAAAVYAKVSLREFTAELHNPNCVLGGPGDMRTIAGKIDQSLGDACQMISKAAAQPCAPSDSGTIEDLRKKLTHIEENYFELLCEVDRRRALIQSGSLVRIQAILNQGLYFLRQMLSTAREVSAELRDWRVEVESTLKSVKHEVQKLRPILESSQKCGSSLHYFEERIRKLENHADKAAEWIRTHQPHANFDRWTSEVFQAVDELLRCETGRISGLTEPLLQINTLACQVAFQTRKFAASSPAAKSGGGDHRLHRFRFEGFPPGAKRTVRVLNTKGEFISELVTDESGEVTHPARPGEELRFVGLHDGIPFETITMKG